MSRRAFPRRWPMLRLADAMVARMPAPKNKSGVLILRMFGIGDALLFRAVLEKYAEALGVSLDQVTVLGSTAWAPAGPFFGAVKIELIDERRFTRNFFYRLRVMMDIRRRGFKIAICGMRLRYPHVIESLMLSSGADQTIIAAARPNEKFDAMFAHYAPLMTHVVIQSEADKPRMADGTPLPLMHEITQQLSFLSAIAGRTIELKALPKLPVPAGAPPLVREGARYAVLAIGASHAPRRWPLAHFFDIARRLMEQGWMVVLVGGPAEAELKDKMDDFKAGLPSDGKAHTLISINQLDFMQATQLVAGAALIVSNDSGLGHLAIMLDKPSVLILGGGHFGSFMPYPADLTPPTVRVLYHLMPCYHCNWNCTMMPPGGTVFPCVDGVSVNAVWDAVKDVA